MTKIRKSKGGVNERRKRVIARLENQLKIGKKPLKDKGFIKTNIALDTIFTTVDLTDQDKARIEKELQTLKSRII